MIDPFYYQIKKKEININIENNLENEDLVLKTDWKLYKLILFNLV